MNKKRLGTGLIALALVGVVGIGGSLAWFTDNASTSNTFTNGHIDISISESTTNENAEETENGIEYSNVQPGDLINKEVTVSKNVGSQNAWVRLVIEVTGNKVVTALTDDNPTNNIVFKNGETPLSLTWTLDNSNPELLKATAIYDAKVALVGDTNSWQPFDSVQVPTAWGNDYADATFAINLTAEAVQYDNNETAGFAAEGVVIQPYTEE